MAVCSVNSGLFTQPVDLGAAEVVTQGPHQMAFWLDRDLSFLRLEGLTASIAQRGSFALVVPTPPLPTTTPRWLEMELIVRASNGRWWHRGGQSGIYNESLEQARAGGFGLFNAAQFVMRCDSGGVHCLVGKARLPDLFALGMATIAVTLVVCAVLAA